MKPAFSHVPSRPAGDSLSGSRLRLALHVAVALLALASLTLLPGCAANRSADEGPAKLVLKWWQAKTQTQADQPRGATLLIQPQPRSALIQGRVMLNGIPPTEQSIPVPPPVAKVSPRPFLKTRFHVRSPDGGLADVLVYVKSGLDGQVFPVPTNTFVVRADHYEFQPYIGAVQAGQPVRWECVETGVLNLNPTPTNRDNREFSYALLTNRPVEAKFAAPELFVRVKTDVYPWMSHYLSVLPHPFFAVTDAEGRFRFPQPLPPGKYTLAAVHRKAGETELTLDLMRPSLTDQPALNVIFQFDGLTHGTPLAGRAPPAGAAVATPLQTAHPVSALPLAPDELAERNQRVQGEIRELENVFRTEHPKLAGLRRQLETVEEALRQSEIQFHAGSADLDVKRLAKMAGGGDWSPAQQKLLQRLDRIVIPELLYDGLPFAEVVKLLAHDAKRFDPEKRGINFLINSAGQPGDRDTWVDLDTALITITPVMNGLSLAQLLELICKTADVKRQNGQRAGLQFTVEDYGIIFTPRDFANPFVAPRRAERPVGAGLRAKLDKIVIPQVVYDGLPLFEVIRMISADTRKHDPDKQGVNILATRFFPDPPAGEPPDLETVLINARQALDGLTLAQVLDVICKTADQPIAYRIEDSVVLLTPDYAKKGPQKPPAPAAVAPHPPLPLATPVTPAAPAAGRPVNAALAREHSERLEALVKALRANPANTPQDYANVAGLIEQALAEYAAVLKPDAPELVWLKQLLNEVKPPAPKPGASLQPAPVGDDVRSLTSPQKPDAKPQPPSTSQRFVNPAAPRESRSDAPPPVGSLRAPTLAFPSARTLVEQRMTRLAVTLEAARKIPGPGDPQLVVLEERWNTLQKAFTQSLAIETHLRLAVWLDQKLANPALTPDERLDYYAAIASNPGEVGSEEIAAILKDKESWAELQRNKQTLEARLKELASTYQPGHAKMKEASNQLQQLDQALDLTVKAAAGHFALFKRKLQLADEALAQTLEPDAAPPSPSRFPSALLLHPVNPLRIPADQLPANSFKLLHPTLPPKLVGTGGQNSEFGIRNSESSQNLLTSAATPEKRLVADAGSSAIAPAEASAARQQEVKRALDKLLNEAEVFRKAKSWTNAVVRYEEAARLAQSGGGAESWDQEKALARAGLTHCRIQFATDLLERFEFKAAAAEVDKVLPFDPGNTEVERFKQLTIRVEEVHRGRVTGKLLLGKDPELRKQREEEVAELVRDGQLSYRRQEFENAKQKLEAAIKQDPANEAAYYFLVLVRESEFEAESKRRERMYRDRVVAVTKKWNGENRAGLPVPNQYVLTNSEVPFRTHSNKGAHRLNRKLDEIILPEVHFDGVPLAEVVKRLTEDAKKFDPEKKGLNFLINDVTPQLTLLDANGNPVPVARPVALSEGLIRVGQPLKDLTLRHALDVICKTAEVPMVFSVEEYAIAFIPRGPVAYYTRMFRLDPNTFMQGLQGVVGSPVVGQSVPAASPIGQGSSTTTGPVRATVPAVAATQRTPTEINALVRQYFQAAGVTNLSATNASTRVTYNPDNGLLLARGTTNDLRAIEHAIQQVQPASTLPANR